MKMIKFLLSPEAFFLAAICLSVRGLLPKTIVPFAFILIGMIYLSYVLVRAARIHIPSKSRFGAISGAIFFLVFGICLVFIRDQVMISIGLAAFITFAIQMPWVARESKYSS